SIVTNSRGNPAVDVGNGHIFGTVDTGPGGVITYNNGSVGDVAWASSNTGVQPGYSNDDMNVSYPDQSPPPNTLLWLAPLPGLYVYGGTNYTYSIGSENKKVLGTFTMNAGDKMILTGN